MYRGVQRHDCISIMHNAQNLANSAKLFEVPPIISTVAKHSFRSRFMPEVTDLLLGQAAIGRMSINI